MNKKISKVVAVLALLSQVLIPVWWAAVAASFYYFWIEGIIEGGGINIYGEYEGNILWGLLSIYSIIAAFSAIKESFSKLSVQKQKGGRGNAVFFLINILTIILVAVVVFLNGGLIPRI
jgi:hypothetical protein